MLKAVGRKADGTPTLFLGLSEQNLRRLRRDEPIAFGTGELGLPAIEVVIFAAPTEEQAEALLRELFGGPPRRRVRLDGDDRAAVRASLDQDALVAAVDLVGRSGCRDVEVGYLYDEEDPPPGWPGGAVPVEAAGWWAKATYGGAVLMAEDYPGPVEAVEALARRVLDGATCGRCGEPIRLADGDPGCRWRRYGDRWDPGCGLPPRRPARADRAPAPGNRAARRRRGGRRR